MTDIFRSNKEIIQHTNQRIWYRTIPPITFWYCCATYSLQEKEICYKMLLLNSWKCIWSETWKFICFSVMTFSFWPLALFGDSEYNEEFSISFSEKILTTSSISAIFLFLLSAPHFLSFPFILGHHQSQSTHRCTTFWSSKPLHELLQFFTFFCYCNDMFTVFFSAINATSVAFKRPSFLRRDTKNATKQHYRIRQLHQVFPGRNHHSPPKTWPFQTFFQEHSVGCFEKTAFKREAFNEL